MHNLAKILAMIVPEAGGPETYDIGPPEEMLLPEKTNSCPIYLNKNPKRSNCQ